jgi:hypothetical protein
VIYKQLIQQNQLDIAIYVGSQSVQDAVQYNDTMFRPFIILGIGMYKLYNY